MNLNNLQKPLDRARRIVYSHQAIVLGRANPRTGRIQIGRDIAQAEQPDGGLAQLGERRVRNAEAEGSNPLPSTRRVWSSGSVVMRGAQYSPLHAGLM